MKCPVCQSQVIVKNGFRPNDKQNHKCLNCQRQFLEDLENKTICTEDKELEKVY